jgi:molybdenum cofactor cytidylyltransferase
VNKESGWKVEAIILAAGYSSRAKDFKMELLIGNQTVVEHTISLFEGICSRVIVVGGYHGERICKRIEVYTPKSMNNMEVEYLYNEDYPLGMFTSVQKGCSALKGGDFFITPGDYPLVKKETLQRLIAQKGEVVIPSFEGKGGHPIYLSERVSKEIVNRPKEDQLRNVLSHFQKKYVKVEDEGVLMDLDTPKDYEELLKKYEYIKK